VCDELVQHLRAHDRRPSSSRGQPAPRAGDVRRHRHPLHRREHRDRDGRLRGPSPRRARARPGRHQVERAAARRISGRPAPCGGGKPRRGDAVLHRVEGAQHRAARPGAATGLQAERIRALPGGRHVARRRRHRREHLQCSRAALRGARAARAPRRARRQRGGHAARARDPRRPARRPPHAHDRGDGREPLEVMAAAAHRLGYDVHRHHRPQQVAGDGQRPRRAPRSSTPRACGR
jgi:hypothetical protein